MKQVSISFQSIKFKKLLYNAGNLRLVTKGITVLKGDSGTGKTTFINQLFYNHKDQCILLSQHNNLIIDDLSVLDNILFGQSEKYNQALEILKTLNFDYILKRSTLHLSGGERRIALIVRSFLMDKPILLLDEPTNSLDFDKVRILKQLLKLIALEKCIVVVTHDDRLIEVADYVYKLQHHDWVLVNDVKESELITLPTKHAKSIPFKSMIKASLALKIYLIFFTLLFTINIGNLAYQSNRLIASGFPSNQIDVGSGLPELFENLVAAGFLPEVIFQEVLPTNNRVISVIKQTLESPSFGTAPIKFTIEESEYYHIFPIVYLDLISGELVKFAELYADAYYELNGKYPNIKNTLSVGSTIPFEKIGEEDTPLDVSLYNEVVSAIVLDRDADDFLPLLVSLLFDESLTLDYVVDYLSTHQQNRFIRTTRSIELTNGLILYEDLTFGLIVLVMVGVGYLILILIDLLLTLKTNQGLIISLRNIGESMNHIINEYLRKTIPIKTMGMSWVFTLITLIALVKFTPFVWINLLSFIVLFPSILIVQVLLTYGIVRFYIKRIFTFGGIYREIKH